MKIKVTMICKGEVDSRIIESSMPQIGAVAFERFADSFDFIDEDIDDYGVSFHKFADEMAVLTLVDVEGPSVVTFESDY